MAESELARERQVIAALYERLDAQRADAERRLAAVRSEQVGGGHQARSERDAFARLHEDRIAQLREVDARLVFGRLLLADAQRHIGRIGLRDEEGQTVLVDWRAPQAAPFYQATAAQPQGVRARRHITMSGRQATRIDDEVFDESLLEAGESAGLQGEGALMAAITARRTGRMHDIVGTIQAEQDRIIRSDHHGALVVQGAPGTGKTAVALHRAAYLLYSRHERLRASGVLVVGPSPAFMNYIDTVLPALGETGVVMRSLGELLPGVAATAEDEPAVAAVKGDIAMVRLLARAVRSRQQVPAAAQSVQVGDDRLLIEPELIERAIQAAQRSRAPHNRARVTFVRAALAELTERLAGQLRAAGATLDDDDVAALHEDLRTSYDVRVALNTAWLPLSPQKLLQDLYARPQWLAELTPHWPDAKRELLHRERSAPFTIADVPLLDEAAELLGPFPETHESAVQARERARQRERDLENARAAIRNTGVEGIVSPERLVDDFAAPAASLTTAERAASDRTWTYGHVVVDEAQELSPMQWRLLVRRCPARSFTIVGDMAQATAPAAAAGWADALGRFFRDNWRLEQLTVNYRTPAVVAEDADAFAARRGLAVTPARAVRRGEWPVARHRADARRMPQAVLAHAEALRQPGQPAWDGTLAVIAPAARVSALAQALRDRFGAAAGTAENAHRPVCVLAAREAKGLEFDSVLLVAPEEIERESSRGAAAVYVAMTRATARLVVLEAVESAG